MYIMYIFYGVSTRRLNLFIFCLLCLFYFLLKLDCFYLITGISNITSDQESVFTVSNLVRKIKFESGSVLRPTPARAQVPNDCLDGTLSVCALSNVSKKSSSKTNFVVLSSKTKSAGKNKFAIEWYTCNKKDELSLNKVKIMNWEVDSRVVVLYERPGSELGCSKN